MEGNVRNVTGGARIIRNLLPNEYGHRRAECCALFSAFLKRAAAYWGLEASNRIDTFQWVTHNEYSINMFCFGALYYPPLSRLWQFWGVYTIHNTYVFTVFELYAWTVRSTTHDMTVVFFFAFVSPLSLYFRRIFLEAEYVNVRCWLFSVIHVWLAD